LLSRVTSSDHESDKQKARYFNALLKELSLRGLQNDDDKFMATLAMSGFIVRPRTDEEEVLFSNHDRRRIEIPESLLLAVLSAPAGQEKNTFNSALRATGEKERGRQRDFTPQSGYVDSLRAYFELCIEFRDTGGPFEVDKLIERFGEAVVTDLRTIGAISSDRRNTAYFVSPFSNADPNHAFEALAKSQATVQKTEELLLAKPDAPPVEVGRFIGKYLGRNWTESSAKRYGGQLKNWARRQQSDARGRSAMISGITEEFVVTLEARGRSPKEIGGLLNMNPETVRRYFRDKDEPD
jgi:hypothetical protein